ncbi:MAG: hypothetical protein J7K98_03055 [Candidatus Aenigmarchaeota archaeon]|nr:hypothetical protein [Candidatus Aenigmarchaeota archaeon]
MDESRWRELKRKEKILKQTASSLRVGEDEILNVVKRFLEEIEKRKVVLEKLRKILKEK